VDSTHSIKGPAGTNGTNGTNGASVLTSAGVPTGVCTTGDSDVDLANGEVYNCTAAAWVDSTYSIMGPAGPAMWISGTISSYSLDLASQAGVPLTAADVITNRIAVVGPVSDVNGCTIYGEFQCGILNMPSASSIEALMSSPVVGDTLTFSVENVNNGYAAEILGSGDGTVTMTDSIPELTTTTFVCQVTDVTSPAITCY
jgi:hypothetical protein